ncbi:unnamed protein product [Cylindrotheca closterium]|uniref:Plastid lipid-associated protein/fibrillin conserved domain-containing protein n=1 Tax=Cylindrotheca closterium TaxID=2856 RepID=A0AAD2G6N2_9STRA|nr:unnamed protein product [Cylindrotheca closterium]
MMKSCIFLFLLKLYFSSAFIFGASREQLKKEIVDLSRSVDRGLTSTPEQDAQILSLFEKLEKMNPTRKTLKSDLVNGVWSLEYTTSALILGKGGVGKRVGPVLQTIDTKSLSAENSEVVDYFGIKVPSKVSAELSPQNDRLTNVQFKRFSFGPFGFDAPEQFKGYLDVTYLDQDLRLTRGDKGNIFVLTRT